MRGAVASVGAEPTVAASDIVATGGAEPTIAASDIVATEGAGPTVAASSRAGAFRCRADYERTWDPDDRVVASAFDELEPLIERIRGYLVRTGWLEG